MANICTLKQYLLITTMVTYLHGPFFCVCNWEHCAEPEKFFVISSSPSASAMEVEYVCLSFLRGRTEGSCRPEHIHSIRKLSFEARGILVVEGRRYAWQETLYMITSSSLFSSISCKVALLFLIFPSLHAVSPFLFSPSLVYIQGSHLLNWKKSMIFHVCLQIYILTW